MVTRIRNRMRKGRLVPKMVSVKKRFGFPSDSALNFVWVWTSNTRTLLFSSYLAATLPPSLIMSLKNVWTSDKSWEPGSFFMFSYVFQCFLTFSNVTYSHSHSHSLSHYLTLSLFLTLTLFQSLIESLLTCWTTFVFISMLKSHSHALTLTHSLSLSLSHSFNLSFNHYRHAEQVLFSCLCSNVTLYRRKC